MDRKEGPASAIAPVEKRQRKARVPLDPSSLLTISKWSTRKVINQESDLRVSKRAVNLLRLEAEERIRKLTRNAATCAKFRGSRTIQEDDINAAKEMI